MRSSLKPSGTDMELRPTKLRGLVVIQPTVHGDARGFFMEAFNKRALAEASIEHEVLQHNQSRSQKGVVRGLHFQWDRPLSKVIRVPRGRAWCVAVDIRHDSPTFGQWVAEELSEENKLVMYAPFGFATGFASLEDPTEVEYYYNAFYNQASESTILWNDPSLGIEWPIDDPILSERDKNAQTLEAWSLRPEARLI